MEIRFGGFLPDTVKRRVTVVTGNGQTLTGRKADVLLCLLQRRGEVLPQEEIYRVVWEGQAATENERSLIEPLHFEDSRVSER